MEAVLIDTDIAIDYLRSSPYAREFVESLWVNDSAFLSVLSIYELFAGIKENERVATDNFIRACNTKKEWGTLSPLRPPYKGGGGAPPAQE
ncbi:hypothetical protein MBAV_001194, partial [Candidatus Magnetobacterium bavaricum]